MMSRKTTPSWVLSILEEGQGMSKEGDFGTCPVCRKGSLEINEEKHLKTGEVLVSYRCSWCGHVEKMGRSGIIRLDH
jgi:hypothetical protein